MLNLIDLAGSERLSRSAVTGDRLKETQVGCGAVTCFELIGCCCWEMLTATKDRLKETQVGWCCCGSQHGAVIP